MSYIPKEELISALKAYLKNNGFKKSKSTWHKVTDDTILVFNVQGSQWGPEYYINLGIYMRDLGAEGKPPINHCHIQRRIEHEEYMGVKKIVDDSLEWLGKHDTIQKLIILSRTNQLPLTTFVEVYKFLEAVKIPE